MAGHSTTSSLSQKQAVGKGFDFASRAVQIAKRKAKNQHSASLFTDNAARMKNVTVSLTSLDLVFFTLWKISDT